MRNLAFAKPPFDEKITEQANDALDFVVTEIFGLLRAQGFVIHGNRIENKNIVDTTKLKNALWELVGDPND